MATVAKPTKNILKARGKKGQKKGFQTVLTLS